MGYLLKSAQGLREFLRNDEGATAIEYGLIGSAVGLTLVAVMPAFQQATNNTYNEIASFFYG